MLTPGLSISAFFPAYNEAGNLRGLIRDANEVLRNICLDYEIIVIDDGSTDGSSRLLSALQRHFPRLRVVRHPRNRGYGAAVVTGLRTATKPYIFFSDADRQFDLREIKNLLEKINDYDVVVGYRAYRQDNIVRGLAAWTWNSLVHRLFRMNYRDIDCAFKLFRREALERIDLDGLSSVGAMISVELMAKLKQNKAKIIELPVTHYPRRHGQSTGLHPQVVGRALVELYRFYRQGAMKS